MWKRGREEEAGQGTVEWIGLLLLVGLLMAGLVAAGVRIPGAALARSIAGRIVCAIQLSDACGRDPELAAAYGSELAGLIREHAPGIAYEPGMHALPVDFRDCRATGCGDGASVGLVRHSRTGEPVVLFVHVVDCRAGVRHDPSYACSGDRAGNLYIQYWTYYADSATLRGVPIVGEEGYHPDDWEGYQVRIGPDGEADARASSHDGYNYELSRINWPSDAGIDPVRDATELVGLREHHGWGPEIGWLFVSGGSHAGHADGDILAAGRLTLRRYLRLVPLEPLVAGEGGPLPRFAISPPWLKRVWRDPETEGTD